MPLTDRAALTSGLVAASLEAGAAIWRYFQDGFDVITKADASPVTAADHAAEAIILAALARLAPGVPVVAEEEVAAGRIPAVGERFFLVDPLDGTKQFVQRGRDFTVNIGLIEHGAPTLGVVYAPAYSRLFVGDTVEGAAWEATVTPGALAVDATRPLRVRVRATPPVALLSRSHGSPDTDAWLGLLGEVKRVGVASSLKFGLLAAAEADLYPRLSPTSEWDTAAGDAVLRAAGGSTFDIHGALFTYGKPGFLNPGFVATSGFEVPPLSRMMRPLSEDVV